MTPNLYLYSKFLFHRVGSQTAIDYLNEHFKQKYGHKAIIYASTHQFPEIEDGQFGFDHYMAYIINDTDYMSSIKLLCDDVDFFQELWRIFPVWEVFSYLNLYLNFEQKKQHINQKKSVSLLDTLLASVGEGWVSFLGADDEPLAVAKTFCGRTYIDALDLSVEDYHHLGEEMTELFIDKVYAMEEESALVHPDDFWRYQLAEKNHHAIAQRFIHTLFRFYRRALPQLEHDMLSIRQCTAFCKASKQSFLAILDESEAQTSLYPKYAGYAHITDSKKWISTLINMIDGTATLEDLRD